MKAFISYSMNNPKDQEKYKDICWQMEEKSIPYWKTDEIAAGEQLNDKLREAVTGCAVCVFIATKNSLASKWCMAEIGAFWGAGKPVIVYMCDDMLEDADLPAQLQGDKWTRQMREVLESLKRHLAKAAQDEREQRSPLVDYDRLSVVHTIKVKGLREATKEVWLIGATMHHTLGNTPKLIVDKIMAGLQLYVLIADPAGKQFEVTAHAFGQEKEALEEEAVTTLKACRRIKSQLDQQPVVAGSLNVRLVDDLFTAGVYFFDPGSETGRMLLVPHVPGVDAAETPGFIFQPAPKNPLEDYFALYQRMWGRATPFEVWAEKNASYLS